MNHIVIWSPVAEQELAAVWLSSTNRNEITAAANRIDRVLIEQGAQAGESRSGRTRIFFDRPLGVTFRLSRDGRILRVLHVWSYSTRKR